ncbi:MAG: hypothetical protein WBW13_09115 [Pseudolabrys sp.]|jgi:hypothetical protein
MTDQTDDDKQTALDPYAEIAARNPKFREAQREETAADIFMKAVAGNPRFKLAPNTGEGFVIVGARPDPARQTRPKKS